MSGWGDRVPMSQLFKPNLLPNELAQKPTQRHTLPTTFKLFSENQIKSSPMHQFEDWDEESYSQAFNCYSMIEQLQDRINKLVQQNFEHEETSKQLQEMLEKNDELSNYYEKLRKECDEIHQAQMEQGSNSYFQDE